MSTSMKRPPAEARPSRTAAEPAASAGGGRPEAVEGERRTATYEGMRAQDLASVRRFHVTTEGGPLPRRRWESTANECTIGSHPLNDLLIEEPTVSRFHCEIRVGPRGPRVRDLGSRNGTILDGVEIEAAYLRPGSVIQLGRVALRFDFGAGQNRLPMSERTELGGLVGRGAAMRGVFGLMERAAASDVTVLFEGESGTGKSEAAEVIHQEGARKERPFLVVDCGAIPANLIESELFGHEKGAFTGAASRRVGVFEEAAGGTVFLDEIGDLPLDLQPKLLRVLEKREIRRVGSNASTSVDVRILAATHRDLRAEVNAGKFRSDLYFRLAVLRIRVPALRERIEDMALLVPRILATLGAAPDVASVLATPAFVADLSRSAWPGNIRELRNHLERCLLFEEALPPAGFDPGPVQCADASVPLAVARRRASDAFERAYLEELLRRHEGNVTKAAKAADVARVYLHRMLSRHGIRR